MRGLGYRAERVRPRYAAHGYLAGPDADRLAELNTVLRDPDLKAVFCVRGGYGTLRLLPRLDYTAARAHPKLLVGYSDITALQLALFHRAGWRSLSGLMVASDWHAPDPDAERLFWALARGGMPDPLLGPGGEVLAPERPGTAEGVLLGGNLSMLCRLVGTPYLPPLEGAILFLEDVGEPPYRIDGLLAQLRLAGLLERLGGLLFGRFTGWDEEEAAPTLSLDEVLREYASDVDGPVASSLVYGHLPRKNTLPLGVRARLSVTEDAAALSLLEPATTPS